MTDYLKFFYEQEKETNERIERDIEKYRKSDFSVTITDKTGAPVKAEVKIRQKKHAFKFGCNIFMLDQFPDDEHNKAYRDKFCELFNYAIAPFYWSDYEPIDGQPRVGKNAVNVYRRPAPELVLEYAKKHGLELKGHPLFWHLFLPEWLGTDKEYNMLRLDKRIREIADEYATRIPDFDVINETLSRHPENTTYEPKMPYDCDNRTFILADKYLPNNRLFINETTTWAWRHFNHEHSPYYMQIENLLMKGRRIDAIGFQYHLFYTPEKLLNERIDTLLNPKRLFAVMDTYSEFNRPLHVSEITVPAYNGTAESMAEQAEITERLYKLWFSCKNVESIVWWNLVDGTAAFAPLGSNEGENYYHGGLLNYDMSEKPVYKTLKNLILNEWMTKIEITVDGKRDLRGFLGDYEIEVITESGIVKQTFTVGKDNNEIKITL